MANEKDKQLLCVKRWETAVSNGTIDYIGLYMYRCRKWARNEYAYTFTKDDIEEFKGISLGSQPKYPYLAVYDLQNTSRYQLGQPIFNGRLFFGFVDFYITLINGLFSNNSPICHFYESYCYYDGWARAGDTYVREMYETALIHYFDKFGDAELVDASRYLYKWAYILRLNKQRVFHSSVDSYINGSNIFEAINRAYNPRQVLATKLGKVENKYHIKKIAEIVS